MGKRISIILCILVVCLPLSVYASKKHEPLTQINCGLVQDCNYSSFVNGVGSFIWTPGQYNGPNGPTQFSPPFNGLDEPLLNGLHQDSMGAPNVNPGTYQFTAIVNTSAGGGVSADWEVRIRDNVGNIFTDQQGIFNGIPPGGPTDFFGTPITVTFNVTATVTSIQFDMVMPGLQTATDLVIISPTIEMIPNPTPVACPNGINTPLTENISDTVCTTTANMWIDSKGGNVGDVVELDLSVFVMWIMYLLGLWLGVTGLRLE